MQGKVEKFPGNIYRIVNIDPVTEADIEEICETPDYASVISKAKPGLYDVRKVVSIQIDRECSHKSWDHWLPSKDKPICTSCSTCDSAKVAMVVNEPIDKYRDKVQRLKDDLAQAEKNLIELARNYMISNSVLEELKRQEKNR